MLSRTSEYALRAAVFLAQHIDEWPVPGRRVAEATGVPPKYLSNILRDLVRAGVLESAPGIGGGFRMARSPKDVRLQDVLQPFEPILGPSRPCPFGNEVCSDETPCGGHDRWKRVRGVYSDFLLKTSVYDVSAQHTASGRNGARKKKPAR